MSGLLDEFVSWAQNFTGLNISKPTPPADPNTQAADAGAIETEMRADQQKQQMERWKILQDTQTQIFEVQQEVTANKAQTQERAQDDLANYIRQ